MGNKAFEDRALLPGPEARACVSKGPGSAARVPFVYEQLSPPSRRKEARRGIRKENNGRLAEINRAHVIISTVPAVTDV